nr:hypothetical protein [Tanacetum cinerariifolium]
MPIAPAPPSPTSAPSPSLQDLISTPHATPPQDQPFIPHSSPPQKPPTTTSKYSMSLLTPLMETYATLSQKVAELEQDKNAKALDILQLKKRVKKSEKKKRSKSLGFKRLRRDGTAQRVESSTDTILDMDPLEFSLVHLVVTSVFVLNRDGADGVECFPNDEIFKELVRMKYEKLPPNLTFYKAFFSALWKFLIHTLVYMVRNMDSPSKFLIYPCFIQIVLDDQVADMFTHNTRYISPALTQKVFVNMMGVRKGFLGVETLLFSSILPQGRINQEDVNAASKGVSVAEPTVFDDEEVTMTMAQTLIKLKKPISIAQARKNMIIYLKNMAGYEMEHFRVPSVDKEKAFLVELKRLFELDANDVLWKLQRYMHAPLRWKLYTDCGVHHVSSTRGHDIFMLREKDYPLSNVVMILMLSGKLHVEEDNEMARDLVMKIFMEANKLKGKMPSVDKEKAFLVELKRLFELDANDVLWKLQRYMHAPLRWKLYTDCGVHHVSSTRGHDIFMLREKDYPLSNVVMILMLSGKLHVEEDNEMARDLVMKIFMEANKLKGKSLDTSSK